MSEKFNIFFIDDELNSSDDTQANVRVVLVNQLNKDGRFNIIPYHPVDFIKQTSDDQIKIMPDLIIIDYKLSGGSNTKSERYHGTGYSMTSYCKERFSDVPCYLISQLIDHDVSVSEHYDKKLSHGFLTRLSGRDNLASDCLSYKSLKDFMSEFKGQELITKVLKVPHEEMTNLKVATPSEFWNELNFEQPKSITDSESIIIKFTKWVNSTLLVKRGPLINSLELATLLGVSESFFKEGLINGEPLENLFSEERYTGLFCESFPPKWWAQQSYNKIMEILEWQGGAEPWKVFPAKLNIPEEYQSVCPVCGNKFPETVAKDKERGVDHCCHWICCTAGELIDDVVGFEPQLYLDV
ncbi:hypothetical protein [Pantoea sp. SM3]|uniref:hypothetical protein n=1 Tax=Pantoea sp. SM3 TaxID=1628192 RepID=UPI0005F7E179|nr:hypothetical protein [Pantoea sp. SM3]KJV27309.1 hypothetical protein VI01_19660 [Pantoea sp. SM3]